ncbi:hypothetical protein [Sanguibacter antarcticus]|uniref:Uncharacterized protein n=1 Tax=Sanguibacter antarcticus TaxID=372484 RepID=A0A2A9E5I7_9MICO|nr:hypothetical protein [Sanguibacter antarcticus]PFG33916.1 hypothetical protein ATL42_1810 [Sanguibacter antarcticus]
MYIHPGVWVSDRYCAMGPDGVEDPMLTVVGPMLEGQKSFQFSAARPVAGHDVLSGIERAIDALLTEGVGAEPIAAMP